MLNPFSKEKVANIYQQKSTLKIIVLIISAVIGATSIYYTNSLVKELKEREKTYISLYAKTIETAANQDNEDIPFLFQEIIVPNTNIPVILTDNMGNYVNHRNIDIKESYSEEKKKEIIEKQLAEMREAYPPIEILLKDPKTGMVYDYQFVYYKNSFLLTQLQYYPYIQLFVIAGFALLAYLIFSYSRTAEQNRVWIGMAKETAHQLGTPLSSLMAWLEYFRSDPEVYDPTIVKELDKDISRLEMITSRFSSIGSVPALKEENLYHVVKNTVNYLQTRVSSKVRMHLQVESETIHVMINKPLFDWVIENICKNAVDAMSGVGDITIRIMREKSDKVIMDITDTGKGIPKSKINQVFTPGYTTKKRGWGLGLSLAQRIIENYHKGKIFVKRSEVDVGTTFRIILNTNPNVNGSKLKKEAKVTVIK